MREYEDLVLARMLHDFVVRHLIHELQPFDGLCLCQSDKLLA